MSVQVSWQEESESERTRRYHRNGSSVDRKKACIVTAERNGWVEHRVLLSFAFGGYSIFLFGEALWRLDKGTCYHCLLSCGGFTGV
jgi:hypothetical protein